MDTSGIVQLLQGALDTWNSNLSSIMGMLTTSPQNFQGGGIWEKMTDISDSLQALALSLLVLFFFFDLPRQMSNIAEMKRPEVAAKAFFRYAVSQYVVIHGMDILSTVFTLCAGIIQMVAGKVITAEGLTVPPELVTKLNAVDFMHSIPLWPAALLCSLGIQVCAVIVLITVYGRFFRLFLYTAFAPIALSTFAGQSTSRHGTSFIRSYIAVCLEGAVIAFGCIVYTAFATAPILDTNGDALAMMWKYVAGIIINMIILITAIRGSDRFIKDMMGL